MSDSINSEVVLFCPGQRGDFYQQIDNNITKDRLYKTPNDNLPRQRYYGHGGKHRLAETRYSDGYNQPGRFKEVDVD